MDKINLNDHPYEYGGAVSNPTAEENGRSFTLDNQSGFKVKKWAIDEKIFKNRNEKRCDYLFLVEHENSNKYYWIELKGSDVVAACRQILTTISNVNVERTAVQHARIISTRTYALSLRSRDYLRLDDRVSKTGGNIMVRNIHYTERI